MVPNKKALQRRLEKALEPEFGKRCESKDLDDFPELNEKTDSRCPVCVVYERLDAFIEELWSVL